MTEEDYILLVYKNLKEEISAEDFDLLNKTTASDSQLANTRFEIEDAWDVSGHDVNLVSEADTNVLFDKVVNKEGVLKPIRSDEHKSSKDTPTKIFSLNRIISSIAAVMVLALGAVFLFQNDTTTYEKAGVYTLADNSTVTLREGSMLKIQKFDDSQRNVTLQGEAYFEISKDADRPFNVDGKHVKIQVLGTSFLVKESGDDTYIDLTEGKIRTTDIRTQKAEILTAGMKAHHKSNGEIDIISNFNNLASWREGLYQYKDTKLGSVIEELSVIFDKKIVIINKDLLDCSFSGNLVGKSLDDVLGPIAEKYKIDILQQESQWILSNGVCN